MILMGKNSQKGFSLVELMVVVAIIGVLASLAVPQVNKYIAKARQSEAKTMLSSIYTSEKAFYAEYSAYHSMFGAIGYSPEGRLRYNAGFASTSTLDAGTSQGYTGTPSTAPGTATNTSGYCGASGTIANGCTVLDGANNTTAPTLNSTAVITAGPLFTAEAAAVVYGSGAGAPVDRWTIDNNKILTNSSPGVN